MDVYEDPNSGAFLQAIVDPEGPARTVVSVDAYADVAPGKKIVSQWTVGSLQYVLTTMTSQRIADADLLPPQPTATWSFGGGTIPIDLFDLSTQAYEPRVELTVNGITGVFVLDTGTQSIVLFDNFARRVGVVAIDGADFSSFVNQPRYQGYGLVNTLRR
jgi:predicted aspartyl protease